LRGIQRQLAAERHPFDGQGGHRSKGVGMVKKSEERRNRGFVGIGGDRFLRYSRSKAMSSAYVGGIFFFPLPRVGETMWASGQVGGQHLILRAALGARGFPRIAVV
jgi:hypothetical protein